MDPLLIGVVVWLFSAPVFIVLWLLAKRRVSRLKKYAVEAKYKNSELVGKLDGFDALEVERTKHEAELQKLATAIEETRKTYSEKRAFLDQLKEQVAIFDERLSFAELGVYEPHFDFGDSEEYKNEIKEIRACQKAMISEKRATVCPTDWTVEGSKAKGRTMINRQSRLTLRAFNNECEAAIANTRWNNVVAMEKRILKAAEAISRENISMNLYIDEEYINLKIEELRYVHEYHEKLKAEKDERAERTRMEREEKRLLAAAAAAKADEQKYQDMLAKARAEIGLAADTEAAQARIEELEQALAKAHAETERAQAMAERTKSGYVYIISNVGSFGEDMVKIGLTRRLDPDDRVRELGDASVPFQFDTHAMIYSEEAPALEAALHAEFSEARVNMSNLRKEFFRVSLEDVEEAVARLAPDAVFFKDREAQEWHETMARRNERLKADVANLGEVLPAEI
jgi:hypothetical protein